MEETERLHESFEDFKQKHLYQLMFSSIPENFWPSLHQKLENEVFDAGNYFTMCYCEEEIEESTSGGSTPEVDGHVSEPGAEATEYFYLKRGTRDWKVLVNREGGIDPEDPNCIFLVDHSWTYRLSEARSDLCCVPGLLKRICKIMDIERGDGVSDQKLTEFIVRNLWRYSQTYSIYNYADEDEDIENRLPIWYMMDEFGSRIQHSDHPNVRVIPFYYITGKITYSLLFPTEHVDAQVEVTRDFVAGSLFHRADWRDFYLLPWIQKDFSEHPCFSVISDAMFSEGRVNDLLPETVISTENTGVDLCRKVFSESQKVREMLKHPAFRFVDREEDADILWYYSPFKDFRELLHHRPNILINQFPFEDILTVKDLLAMLIKSHYVSQQVDPKTLETRPSWLCTTYSLQLELPQFVSYFQQRAKRDLDNHWIIKPFNLGRSLDSYITDEIGQIIRLMDSGPKIACKYIEDPVLFYRDDLDSWVKFDIRFIVLLKSVKPLTLYIYDRFWLRFALKQFDLDNCDDIEKHFTVFNYMKEKKVKQMRCDQFIPEFCKQYPEIKWNVVMDQIKAIIKEAFELATRERPPKGLLPVPQCRAMYGVDIMLRWCHEGGKKSVQPTLLEINFMPDFTRACEYYPDFMNTVFEVLFLDDFSPAQPVTLL